MDFTAPVLLYCERNDPGLWAEPLNVLTNLAYFWFAWKLWSASATSHPNLVQPQRLLAGLIALVGAASLSFHLLATRGANILDVAFIGLFNVVYLVIFLRVVARWSGLSAIAAGAGFVLVDRVSAAVLPDGLLNGSGFYLPALATLMVLVAYAMRIAPASARRMQLAALVFLVSLGARTIDRGLCAAWPWGTHFVWHLLTAWVLYQLSLALRFGPNRG